MRYRFWSITGIALLASAIIVQASIIVESTVSGTSASTLNLDIDIEAGLASSSSTNFTISGSVSATTAFGGMIGLTLDAMKNVSTNALTRGDKLSDGVFDGDAAGLGVAYAPTLGGIGTDSTSREGILFTFDDLSSLNSSLSVQITAINVQNVFNVDESFVVVNPATRDFLEFDSGNAGNFDVSSLHLEITGGSSGPIAAIYSGDTGGFRVQGLTIAINDSSNSDVEVGTLNISYSAYSKASILVDALVSGSSLSALNLDIDIENGLVSSTNTDFTVSDSIPATSSFDGTIGLTLDAMKNVSTNAMTRGDKLSNGIFYGDSGSLGVQGDPNAGGIGTDTENREGVMFSLNNQVTGDYSTTAKISAIHVQNVFDAGESFIVVNPITRDFLEFSSGSAGNFDVSSLELTMIGGASGEVAAIYSGDIGGFRVKGVTLDLIHSGKIIVEGPATTGGVYTLQGTTNLLNNDWNEQEIIVEDTDGLISFETAGSSAQSFYRVVTANESMLSPIGIHMDLDWGYKTELDQLNLGFIRVGIRTLNGLLNPDLNQMLEDNKSRIVCLTLFIIENDDVETTIEAVAKALRRYPNIKYIQTDNESEYDSKWPETAEEYDEYATLHAQIYDGLKQEFPGVQISANFASLLPQTTDASERCDMAFSSFSEYASGKVDSIDFHYHRFWNDAEFIEDEFSGAQDYLQAYPSLENAHLLITENSTWSGDPEEPLYMEVQPQTAEEQALYYFQTAVLSLTHGAHYISLGRLYDRESYLGLPLHPIALNGLFYLDGKEYSDGFHSGPKLAAFTVRLLTYLTAGLQPGYAELTKTGDIYDIQFNGPRPFRVIWLAQGDTLQTPVANYSANGIDGEEYTLLTPVPLESATWPLSDVLSSFPQQTTVCTNGIIELTLKNRMPQILMTSE
jgi:hypothetical protein